MRPWEEKYFTLPKPTPPVKPFSYFDTPGGEDFYRKFLYMEKDAGTIGLALSTIDAVLYSHAREYLHILRTYAFWTGPCLAIGATFVSSHHIACTIRKKDDIYSWGLATASVGPIIGVWTKSPYRGAFWTVILALLGATRKFCWDEGVPLFRLPHRDFGGARAGQLDWSFIKDRPLNWTTGENRKE